MAKCIRIDATKKEVIGHNYIRKNEKGDIIENKNMWHESTWTNKTEYYYLVSDDSYIEGI